MKKSPLNGLILAGGKSTRMGTDKGLLQYHGKAQREFLFELLEEFCVEVYTSCRIEQRIEDKWNPLTDKFDMAGPMNGILTAFHVRPDAAWIVIAVDLPYISRDTLKMLVDNRDPNKIATCFYNREREHPEPLLSLWEEKANYLLTDFVRKGKASPREFLKTHPVKLINPPNGKILLNVNTPEDLEPRT